MEEDIRRAKRLLESKGYHVEKKLIFEGLDESDVVPLNEFLDVHGSEYAWEYSLEESLYESRFEGDQLKEYEVGDIIMPMRLRSTQSNEYVEPHKIMLIQTKDTGDDGVIKYKGFLLSSKKDKSNKYGGYPNNIWIEDYASILYRGSQQHREAFIRVDDIVEFTNEDLDTRGVWKGTVSRSFFNFVNNCYMNYKQGRSNKHRYWYANRRESK